MKKQKKKKKLKKGCLTFILFILFIFIGGNIIYYGFGHNIKNIYIYNNELLNDQEIIELANLQDYPNFYTSSSSKMIKGIKKNKLVKDVKVKKVLFNKINIYVEEYKILFLNQETNKYVLEDGKELLFNKNLIVPTLINYVPDTKYKSFIEKYNNIDKKVIQKISEIKYDPNDIDTDRFLLYMNDGNYVYLTLTKFDLLNKYNDAITKFEGKKGTLYLDSGNYFEIRR